MLKKFIDLAAGVRLSKGAISLSREDLLGLYQLAGVKDTVVETHVDVPCERLCELVDQAKVRESGSYDSDVLSAEAEPEKRKRR